LLATKLRALLQRNKGRDLIDLSDSLQVFENLNAPRVVELLGLYLAVTNLAISRAEAEQRMFAKLESPAFLADVRPLLTAEALLAMLIRLAGSKERRHLDELLDEGLMETFPASDPVSVGDFTSTEPPRRPIDRVGRLRGHC
jgi:hypothetical protein